MLIVRPDFVLPTLTIGRRVSRHWIWL